MAQVGRSRKRWWWHCLAGRHEVYKKIDWESQGSKPLLHGFCFNVLLCLSRRWIGTWKFKMKKPIPLKIPLDHVHYYSNENLTKMEPLNGCCYHSKGKIQYMNWLVWVETQTWDLPYLDHQNQLSLTDLSFPQLGLVFESTRWNPKLNNFLQVIFSPHISLMYLVGKVQACYSLFHFPRTYVTICRDPAWCEYDHHDHNYHFAHHRT